jgi:hypothetical protein
VVRVNPLRQGQIAGLANRHSPDDKVSVTAILDQPFANRCHLRLKPSSTQVRSQLLTAGLLVQLPQNLQLHKNSSITLMSFYLGTFVTK